MNQQLLQKILGDIAANEEYGFVMKKWRELFNITQAKVAQELNIKPSVISDYEGSRRRSPGIGFVRKYVNTIIKLSEIHEKESFEKVKKLLGIVNETNSLLNKTFESKNTESILNLLNAEKLTRRKNSEFFQECIFFSNKISHVLTKMPSKKLFNHFKNSTDKFFIFSKVKSGRIPLILLNLLSKTNKSKMPGLIIFQTNDEFKLSRFVRRMAERNKITLGITNKEISEIKKIVEKL